MLRVLADTGPLVALFDADDRDHDRVVEFLKGFDGMIGTTWPVVTEVNHLLDFNVQTQLDFLEWLRRGGVALADIEVKDLTQIAGLMKKYADAPMDFADATLVFVAEKTNTRKIMTLDEDFYIYRLRGKTAFENVLD